MKVHDIVLSKPTEEIDITSELQTIITPVVYDNWGGFRIVPKGTTPRSVTEPKIII